MQLQPPGSTGKATGARRKSGGPVVSAGFRQDAGPASSPCTNRTAAAAQTRSRMRTRPPGPATPSSGDTASAAGPHLWAQSPEERRAARSWAAPRRAPAPPPAPLRRRQEDATRCPADRPAARRAVLPGRRSGNRRRRRWRRDCFRVTFSWLTCRPPAPWCGRASYEEEGGPSPGGSQPSGPRREVEPDGGRQSHVKNWAPGLERPWSPAAQLPSLQGWDCRWRRPRRVECP